MLNKLIAYFSKHWFKISMSFIAFTFLFLPNNNPLADSISYAGDVKWGLDLFTAHHLLFNSFYFLMYKAVGVLYPSVDAFQLIGFTNGVFALGCLFLLHTILLRKTNDANKAAVWTFFVACSFGFMRFAVETEVYILPIFFSLLSSLFYLNYLKSEKYKYIFFSGLFASIACLFHQIHLFWGIGLFVGLLFEKKTKPLVYFLLSTPIVLITYSLVLVYYYHTSFSINNLFQFLAQYYYTDNADTSFGLKNFIVTAITFTRTFFQVHGIILNVLKLVPLAYAVIPLVIALVVYSIMRIIKSVKCDFNFKNKRFERTHLIIFLFQLAFAIFSYGNSEFMVMLPFALAIFVHQFFNVDFTALKYFSVAMLIWNLTFGILPNHFFDYQNNSAMLKVIEDHPDKIFILKEGSSVLNTYYYAHGVEKFDRIIDNTEIILVEKYKKNNVHFYTDVLTKKVPYNRVDFTTTAPNNKFLFIRQITKINSAMGDFTVDEVKILD